MMESTETAVSKQVRSVPLADPVAGVNSAIRAGLRCVGIAVGQRTKDLSAAGADPVVPDFLALSLSQLHSSQRSICFSLPAGRIRSNS